MKNEGIPKIKLQPKTPANNNRILILWILVAGLFLSHCILRSPNKYFWLDEVLTEIVIRNTTFYQAMDSLMDSINAMPPTYFALLWSWTKIFGDNAMSLRLFSAAGIIVAVTCTSKMLSLAWNWRVATLAAWVSFASSKMILSFNVEARCYALYLAWFCGASFWLVRSWGDETRRRITLVFMGVSTHSLLVTTHYIGVFYSAGLILAGIIGFWVYRRKGCLYYLVGAIPGAATILFCLPFYLDQRTLGGSNSWIGRPSLSEFVVLYQYQINFHVFVLLGFATFILGARSRYSTTESTNSSPLISRSSPKQLAYRQAVLAVILVSISVPAFVWMESQVGMKLFVDRYFLPSFLLWPCIAAFVIAKFADYLSSTCGSVTSLRSGKLHFRNILKHSATTLLASLPFIVLIKDVRHVDETIGKVQERLVVLEHNNMPFASSNLQDVAALRHYSDHEKGEWVALPNDEFYAIRRAEKTVAHSLARRYWPGFVQTPNLLLDGRPSVIAPKMELESWITEGFISREGLVEESLGAGLSIIRKRP